MENRGVHNLQRPPSVKDNPVDADTRAVQRQSAQHNSVAWSRIDVDGIGARVRHYPRLDTVRAGDGDRLGDVNRPKPRAVYGRNLTAGVHGIDRGLKGLARRAEGARISIIAI